MPTAHGLLLPPVNASKAGKVSSLQSKLFESNESWAPKKRPVSELLPPEILKQLVDFYIAAATAPHLQQVPTDNASRVDGADSDADSVDVGRPGRRPNGSAIETRDVSTKEEWDDSKNNIDGLVDNDESIMDTDADGSIPLCTWALSPSEHMLPGRVLQQMRQQEPSPGPPSPSRELDADDGFSTTVMVTLPPQTSSWESANYGDSAVPETFVHGLLANPGTNVTPTSAQPRPIIPCTPDDESLAKQSPLLQRRDVRLAQSDGASASRLSSSSGGHPLQTSQSSPTGKPPRLRLADIDLPAEAAADQEPPVPDAAAASPTTTTTTTTTHKRNSRSEPFDSFCLAYPDYVGSLASFVQACECVSHYQKTLSAPEFLFDDLVRVFDTLWLPYARQQRQHGEDAIALVHYYNAHVQTPVYNKGIINKKVLAVVVPDLQAMQALRLLLASPPTGANGLGLVQHAYPPPHAFVHHRHHTFGGDSILAASTAPYADVIMRPFTTPAITSAFKPPSPAAINSPTDPAAPIALAAGSSTTTTATTATTATDPDLILPPPLAPAPTTTAPVRRYLASLRPDYPPQQSHRLQAPSLAGRKRRASSPSGSVISRRSSSSRSARPSLVAHAVDPTRASPGTANWTQQPRKKKRSYPMPRDGITSQSRV